MTSFILHDTNEVYNAINNVSNDLLLLCYDGMTYARQITVEKTAKDRLQIASSYVKRENTFFGEYCFLLNTMITGRCFNRIWFIVSPAEEQ
jgi:hypothetical protein